MTITHAPTLTPEQVRETVEWIIALEFGGFAQTQETLKGYISTGEQDEEDCEIVSGEIGYCCLGVKCVTMSEAVINGLGFELVDYGDKLEIADDTGNIPDELSSYLGLEFDVPAEPHPAWDTAGLRKYTRHHRTLRETLIKYNDAGKTFSQIAEFLDRFLLRRESFHDCKLLPTDAVPGEVSVQEIPVPVATGSAV